MTHVFMHTLIDTLKMMPLLFAAYLFIEFLEHKASGTLEKTLSKGGKFSVPAGALFGCVPQCGFSAASANLYAGRVISAGTLLAVFLSTSDEAIPILFSHPEKMTSVLWLLGIKIVIAVIAGYIVDFFWKEREDAVFDTHPHHEHHEHHEHDHEHAHYDEHGCHTDGHCHGADDGEEKAQHLVHCGCGHEHKEKGDSIWLCALKRTVNITIFVFVISFIIHTLIHFTHEDILKNLLMSKSIFQPFLVGLVGLIPNCAVSVVITELFIDGTLSFGSVIAGLCTGAGVGLIVLFKSNHNTKENLRILALLYLIGSAAGFLIGLI